MHDLDGELDDALRSLPEVRAPRALLPRVMAAVSHAPGPWYSRAWVTWPRGLQVASAAVVVLAIAAFVFGIPGSSWAASAPTSGMGRALAPVRSAVQTAAEASTLARVFWQTWLQPLAHYFVGVLLVLSLVCSAAYSLVSRLTLEASPR